MAAHSSTLVWKIPWMEKPGRLQSMGSLRVRHDWATSLSLFIFTHWRRKWQPTPVFLPGESQGLEPGGLPSMGSHRVRHDWSDLTAAAFPARFLEAWKEWVSAVMQEMVFVLIMHAKPSSTRIILICVVVVWNIWRVTSEVCLSLYVHWLDWSESDWR